VREELTAGKRGWARSNTSLTGTSTSLGAALEAFILEHEYCGEKHSDVESDRVWLSCTCGATINRDADADRSGPVVQVDSLKKLMIAGLVAVLGFAPAFALAQAQRDETMVEREETMLIGQVQSVDETGTAITLTDGTKLLTPPGSVLRPGALEKGAMVIAMYREENGDKILTRLSLAQSESAPSTPSQSPRRY